MMKPDSANSESWSRLNLAQQLFLRYYVRCFWHMKPDLVVSEAMIPAIVKGLRLHGGREGMLFAEKLAHWPDGNG